MRYIIVLLLSFVLTSCVTTHVPNIPDNQIEDIAYRITEANGLPPLKKIIIDVDNDTINAAYIGNNTIVLNQGLLDSNLTTDQLAFIIAHELGHRTRNDLKSSKDAEFAADKLGFRYIAIAGFNMCRGAAWLKLTHEGPLHPNPKLRYAASGCP